MIAITRAEQPAKLKSSKAKDAWALPEVRAALHDMQASKCCYCEGKLRRSGSRQQIEHYWPKELYDDKRNSWTNLLLACDQCNHRKGKKFPLDDLSQPLVIDPTAGNVNPESELTFAIQFSDYFEFGLVGQVASVNGSVRGATTIEVVGLSEDHHQAERHRHFVEVLFPWLARYDQARKDKDEVEMKALCAELERRMDSRAEYAGFARAFAREYDLPISVPEGAAA